MINVNEKPCIRKSLNIDIVGENITVFNNLTKKSYLLGKSEYNVLVHMDGTNSLQELSNNSKKYNIQQIYSLLKFYEKIGFIEGKDFEIPKEKGLIKRKKIGVINGNKYINIDSLFIKLVYIVIVYLSIPILLFGIWQYYLGTNMFQQVDLTQVVNSSFLVHIISFIIIATLHEFAHAVVARRNGVPVPEIGIMFFLFIPYVYTNMSYIRILKSKWKRILCLLGGILFNVLLSGVFFIIAGNVSSEIRLLFEEIAFMNIFLVISNLMIFFKLDGYFILEEIVDESSLREKSISLIVSKIGDFIKVLFNKNKDDKVKYIHYKEDTMNKLLYYMYGVLCIAYVPVLLLSFALNWLQYLF